MNRADMLGALRDAASGSLPTKRRVLHQLRPALVEPWLDAALQCQLRDLAAACGETLQLEPLRPLAVGECYLLLVGPSGRGEAVRLSVLGEGERGDALPAREVLPALRGLAAAATRAGQSLPHHSFSAARSGSSERITPATSSRATQPSSARMLGRCETECELLSSLRARCNALRTLVDPSRERESWHRLLGEIIPEAARST